jgi:hypothetical protein
MEKLNDIWHRYNPFDIGKYMNALDESLTEVKTSIKRIDDKLDDEIDHIEFELAFNKGLLNILAETIPDMLWLKGSDGRYLYANHKIREQLLFCNPIGKTDVECAVNAKAKFGDREHTFGEMCGNSDKIVEESMKPQRFMESGKIKGKMVYLEVHKAPFIINGVYIGVCGTARDMTPYVEAYNKNGCNRCIKPSDDIFKMFEFENKDK